MLIFCIKATLTPANAELVWSNSLQSITDAKYHKHGGIMLMQINGSHAISEPQYATLIPSTRQFKMKKHIKKKLI
jgi:hypothetical protein